MGFGVDLSDTLEKQHDFQGYGAYEFGLAWISPGSFVYSPLVSIPFLRTDTPHCWMAWLVQDNIHAWNKDFECEELSSRVWWLVITDRPWSG